MESYPIKVDIRIYMGVWTHQKILFEHIIVLQILGRLLILLHY